MRNRDGWNHPAIKRAEELMREGQRDDPNEAKADRAHAEIGSTIRDAERRMWEADLADLERGWEGRLAIPRPDGHGNGGQRHNPHPFGTHAWRTWDMREMGII